MSGRTGRGMRRFFSGTGFYIALFLCVTALAVAGYWSLLPHEKTEVVKAPQEAAVAPPAVTETAEETPVMPELPVPEPEVTPAQQIVELPVPEPAAKPVETVPAPPRLIVSPLSGETITAFSVDELSYSETLGDWRTHGGVDIAADAGTHVLAACSGTVLSVAEDDLLGTTVVLSHDGGYETTYANLQAVPTVAAGQYVSAGQVIGSVGTTSLTESSLAPHLHFAVTKDGAAIDPDDFLKS